MLYKPNFCCNCGEKIERANWSLFTSRRFCGVCETEFKGVDYLPRVAVTAAVLMMVVGAASFLRGDRGVHPSSGTGVSARQSRLSAAVTKPEKPKPDLPEPAAFANANQTTPQAPVVLPPVNSLQRPATQRPSTETAYYCGALTKKGTPCTRRVRSNGVRCFQHQGQPPAADLK